MKNTSEVDQLILKVLSKNLKIQFKNLNEKIEINITPEWDSVNHLNIISSLEEKFKIEFNTKEISELTNFQNIKKIIEQKVSDKK